MKREVPAWAGLLALVLALLAAGTLEANAATGKGAMHRSAAITRVLGYPTTCVPGWRQYLRSEGIDGDAAWVYSVYVNYEGEYETAALADADCLALLKPWLYEDADVAIPLWYLAELAVPSEVANCALAAEFYRLRRVLHIRRSVRVDDYFPLGPCRA